MEGPRLRRQNTKKHGLKGSGKMELDEGKLWERFRKLVQGWLGLIRVHGMPLGVGVGGESGSTG